MTFRQLYQGRIARWHFFLGSLFAGFPIFVFVSVWGIIRILQTTFPITSDSTTVDTLAVVNTFLNAAIGLLITFSIVFYFAFHVLLAIRRCHDFNYTGWLTVFTFIPYIGFIFTLVFLFKKGDENPNKYGPVPADDKPFLADIFNY